MQRIDGRLHRLGEAQNYRPDRAADLAGDFASLHPAYLQPPTAAFYEQALT